MPTRHSPRRDRVACLGGSTPERRPWGASPLARCLARCVLPILACFSIVLSPANCRVGGVDAPLCSSSRFLAERGSWSCWFGSSAAAEGSGWLIPRNPPTCPAGLLALLDALLWARSRSSTLVRPGGCTDTPRTPRRPVACAGMWDAGVRNRRTADLHAHACDVSACGACLDRP